MPSTWITTGTWVRGAEEKVIEAVQAALLVSLKIPDYDRDIVLDVYEAPMRIVPTGWSERYARTEITMFLGAHWKPNAHFTSRLLQNCPS
jgi:hypothetical protein